jgi:AraC-like DNA-binding protein
VDNKDPLYNTIKLPENSEFQINRFIHRNKGFWHIKNHYHDIYEIVLYEEISGHVYLNGNKKVIRRDKLLYLPPYAVHGFDLEQKTNVYTVLHLSPLFLSNRELNPSLSAIPLVLDLDEYSHNFITQLFQWSREDRASLSIRKESILMILLWIADQSGDSFSGRKSGKDFTQLFKLIDTQKKYTIKVGDAACFCNMSRSSFHDHFKRQFGMSFNEFIQEKRIEEAQHLLINTDKTCTEISAALEFSDASHFTKLFKKKTGHLPRFFRRKR